ncbi:MAG: hypothetical protein ACKOAH_01515, partial [Pirellula sp.]
MPGAWQLLSFPSDGLPAGAIVSEIKLGLYGGICYWDGLSITGKVRPEDTLRSDYETWWKHHGKKPVPNLDSELFQGKNVLQAIQEGPAAESGKQLASQVKA